MKTISLNQTVNVAFKQVQLLPALTPEMILGEGGTQTFRPTCPTRPTRPTPALEISRQLPRPQADRGASESFLFAVLAVSTVFTLGVALTQILQWSTNLPRFTAWVMQLLG